MGLADFNWSSITKNTADNSQAFNIKKDTENERKQRQMHYEYEQQMKVEAMREQGKATMENEDALQEFKSKIYDFENCPNLRDFEDTFSNSPDKLLVYQVETTGLNLAEKRTVVLKDGNYDEVIVPVSQPLFFYAKMYERNEEGKYSFKEDYAFPIAVDKEKLIQSIEDSNRGVKPFDLFEKVGTSKGKFLKEDYLENTNVILPFDTAKKEIEKLFNQSVITLSFGTETTGKVFELAGINLRNDFDMQKVANELNANDKFVKGRVTLDNTNKCIGGTKEKSENTEDKVDACFNIANYVIDDCEIRIEPKISKTNGDMLKTVLVEEEVTKTVEDKQQDMLEQMENKGLETHSAMISGDYKEISPDDRDFDDYEYLEEYEYDDYEYEPEEYEDYYNNVEVQKQLTEMRLADNTGNAHGNLYSDKENDKIDIVKADNIQKIGEASIPHVSEALQDKNNANILTNSAIDKLVNALENNNKLIAKQNELESQKVAELVKNNALIKEQNENISKLTMLIENVTKEYSEKDVIDLSKKVSTEKPKQIKPKKVQEGITNP